MARTIASIVTFSVLALVAIVGLVFTCTGFGLGYSQCSAKDAAVCDDAYFSRWWAVVLQAVVAVSVGAIVLSGKLEELRTIAIAFLVVASSVLMAGLDAALFSVEYANEKRNAEFAAGGLALLTLANFVGIIMLGVSGAGGEKRKESWHIRKIVSATLFIVLLLASWGIMLAGTITQQVSCFDDDVEAHCSYKLRFTWWTIAFELVVMVWVAVAMGLNHLEKMGAAISGFIALVTINLMDEAETAVNNLMVDSSDSMKKLVAAGVLLLCIVNLLMVLFFAVGGVMKVHEEETGETPTTCSQWVPGTTIAILPLLLGLAMGLGGVVRVHANFCGSSEKGGCRDAFRSSYWAFAFELVVVVGIITLAVVKKQALPRVRGFVVTFLVLASVETMREVGEMLMTTESTLGMIDPNFKGDASLGISAAGFMVVTAMNFVLLLILGLEETEPTPPAGYTSAPV
ncbi:hypothetical protein BSKO_12241 [Bryopsis sp. KO-2023]|nr:hypothetical protein BSKO_12241 [Bryopsis sp. KO-2023]